MRAILYSQSGKLGSGILTTGAISGKALNGWRAFPIRDEVDIRLSPSLTTIGWVAGAATPGGVVAQALNTALLAAHPGFSHVAYDPVLSNHYIDLANSTRLAVPGTGTFDGCKLQSTACLFRSTSIALPTVPTVVRPFFHVGVYTPVPVDGDPVKLTYAASTIVASLSFNGGATFVSASDGVDLPIPPADQGSHLVVKMFGASTPKWVQGWSVLY